MEDVKKITAKINEATIKEEKVTENVKENAEPQKTTALSKMKAFVRKAVDCCIE